MGGGQQGGSPLEGLVLSALSSQGVHWAALPGCSAAAPPPGAGCRGWCPRFEQQGLGHIAQSWVGDGPNHPVAPEQVQAVLGNDQIQSMANQTGMQPADVLSELARLLPGVVDRLTQGGQTPGPATTA